MKPNPSTAPAPLFRCASFDAIAEAIDVAPITCHFIHAGEHTYALGRWRYFAGRYEVAPMPSPVLVLHVAGKAPIRYLTKQGSWSENYAIPGDLGAVAANEATRWLIDGEVDLLILAVAEPCDTSLQVDYRTSPLSQAYVYQHKVSLGVSDPVFRALMRRLYCQLEGDTDDTEYSLQLLRTLLLHLRQPRSDQRLDESTGTVGRGPAYQFNLVITYIRDHLSDDLNVESLAAMAGIKASYFSEVFKRNTGATPHKYILHKRIERAGELLAETQMPIAAIAQETGFSSQSHLTTTFSRIMGMSPGELRKRRTASVG